MTDQEKLVELIAKIQDYGHKTYYEENAMYMRTITVEELADYLIANGVAVKQMQKPMKASDMLRMKGKKVWVEDKGKCGVICVTLHRCVGSPAVCFNMIRKDGTMFHADVDDMDVRWRCWAEKPTEEERQAAEWEK